MSLVDTTREDYAPTRPPFPDRLAEALAAAQLELPTALERNAEGYGYRYTTLDALLAAVRPILNKHGLSVVQGVNTEDAKRELRTSLHYLTGEVLDCGAVPLAYDGGAKGMQSLGSAITYARRYGLAAALGIASEEDDDAETRE